MSVFSFRGERDTRLFQGSGYDSERKVISILKVLSESAEPLGSITIARELERYGISLSERAIRYHLRITDERGYTQPMGRDGRLLTSKGIEELRLALAPDQVGFILDKLELLAFRTTFDPIKKTGLVPINTSLLDSNKFNDALVLMKEVVKAKLAVSHLISIAEEGEKIGSVIVPPGKIGLATICSVVVNGVLLKSGIPIESRFGGVLEIKESKPRRFTAIINYSGTSLDPSEQYIRARMTNVSDAALNGNGMILANFREIPAPARSVVDEKISLLKEAGISGVYLLGNTSEPVCQISVGLNRVGLVMLGGLNIIATAVEAGLEVDNISESGLVEYSDLQSIWDL
jgi:HTH-type transcriptional regulator, global nitrogen regulator NrpRI